MSGKNERPERPIVIRIRRYRFEVYGVKDAANLARAILREDRRLDGQKVLPMLLRRLPRDPSVPKSTRRKPLLRGLSSGQAADRLAKAKAAKFVAETGKGCKRVVEDEDGFKPCSMGQGHEGECR